MASGARAEEWRRLRSGEVRVAVGARSAVFSPLPDLGLVVVDEEHERSFKQDSAPRYHARDVAVVRGRLESATVLLGSATPSLESYRNAKEGRYQLLELPERVAGGHLPQTEVVDMRAEWADVKQQTLVSRRLAKEMHGRLHRGEQIILFLNRRGFNTWIHCLHCTEVLRCPACDISLTYHQGPKILRCHYCEYEDRVPETCPACGARKLRFAGTGTERVEETVARLFPEARMLRMDADTMTGRDAHAEALSAFARGEYDILLGTQMVAKGHDFPNVTLIGVLFADGSINLPDFRAAENTFQLVMQVVGRAGRGAREGTGIIQAYDPAHYAVQFAAKQDYGGFAARELADRRAHRYPPFGRMARVLVRGPDRDKAAALAQQIADALGAAAPPRAVLGPAPCAIARIQANWRFHALVKAESAGAVARILHAAQDLLKDQGKTRVVVDVDPVSLL
jgi:primosomal protein N' (replication factor Y)